MTPPAILGTSARRKMLASLLLAGALQAVLTIVAAVAFGRVVGSGVGAESLVWVVFLVASAFAALLLHAHIRAKAERFGQAYVAVCRARLLKARVRGQESESRHGLTMTRMITDLSSIKNFVGLGIASGTTSAITLIVLTIGGFWLSGLLGLAISASIAVSLVATLLLYRPLTNAIRRARKARGALAGQVGEALLTTPALRVFGALDREKDILTQRRLMDQPVTLEELSNQYNVSRERIRQIEVRAFEKLQKKMRELAREKGMLGTV